jgi:DNA-binding CsgD family transcriptional regulator
MARSVLVGRESELAVADRFLDWVPGGPAALVIEGEAGIGKTALWLAVRERAGDHGLRVISAMPAESEAHLSYSALSDLVRGVVDEVVEALPLVQQRALAVALLRAEPETDTDGRLVGTALLGMLEALTRAGPLLVAIDDVQWLDRSSMRALEFTARRACGRVGWLLTRRGGESDELPLGLDTAAAGQVQRVVPARLSVAAVHHLLADRANGVLPRPLLLRIHQVSQGNPLLALELARAASPVEAWSPGDPLPVPARLQKLLSERLALLSPAALDVGRVVALMSLPSVAAVAAALDDSTSARAGILEAEDAGVLIEADSRLRFAHPLLGAAVIGHLSPERLRRLHERLASVVSDSEQRARHLAQASTGPNESTAAVLESTALEAAKRGAQEAAAELLEAAARLTPDHHVTDAARRLTCAASSLLAAIDIRGARRLAERALAVAPSGTPRAEVLHVLAQVAWLDSPLPAVTDLLARALSEPNVDPTVTARVHALLASYLVGAPAAEHAAAAARMLDEERDPALLAHVLVARFWAEAMLERGIDRGLLEQGLALEERSGMAAERSTIPLIYYQSVDEQDAARDRYAGDATWYRDRGEDGWVAERGAHLAWLELRAGNWDLADELIEDSCTVIAAGRRAAWLIPFVVRSFIDAHRGRFDRARETLSSILDESGTGHSRWFASIAYFALAFLEHSQQHHTACVDALALMAEQHAELGINDAPPDRSQPFHVESLLALGRREHARAALARLEHRGRVWPRLWITVALPRTRALVVAAEGDVPGALAAIDEVDLQLARRLPFELGSTLLVKGRLQRRAKRKRLAADSLRQALDLFDTLGAPAWAAQTRSELTRLGLHHSAPLELTPTERRIAELVASGLSNPQVAQAAFVSRKTVEANLARIYRKLSIQSRNQLASQLAELPRNDFPDT